MKNQERVLNAHIAEVLDGMRDGWSARAEMLGALRSRGIPDILITERGKPPIVIETEVEPARGLEADTVLRTSQMTTNEESIRAAISVVIPAKFRVNDKAEKIRIGLRTARFRYRARISVGGGGGQG